LFPFPDLLYQLKESTVDGCACGSTLQAVYRKA
jgi:hypothetical protein